MRRLRSAAALVGALAALLALGADTPAPFYDPLERTSPAVVERARAVRAEPLARRIEAISDPWLGRPYELGTLGEAGGVDPDPVTRYDRFDCLTFVEEVLALALSADPGRAQEIRAALRYRDSGSQTYENRNHFMEWEWIPNNVRDGWVVEITDQFAGAEWREKTVTPATWQNWARRYLFKLMAPDRLPTGNLRYPVIPWARALEVIDQIPEGAILFEVRENRAHIPITIAHVGFKLGTDKPRFRNATKRSSMMLRDDNLAWYLSHIGSYDKWNADGIRVVMPQDFGPRPRGP